MTRFAAVALLTGALLGAPAHADEHDIMEMDSELERPSDLTVTLPEMNAAEGRILFATKGCVICHEVNGVGGQRSKAPALDASRMPIEPNPFEFAARMWSGATKMIALQEENLGYKISILPSELAHIFAFVHDAEEQGLFTLPGRGPQ
jgi:cytochrome c